MRRVVVKFSCSTCEDRNASNLGLPGYQWIESSWTTLQEAMQHLNQHRTHYIEAFVELEDNEEDD